MHGEQARHMLIRKIEAAHQQSNFGEPMPTWIYEAQVDELRGHLRLVASRGHCGIGASAGLARRTSGLEHKPTLSLRRR